MYVCCGMSITHCLLWKSPKKSTENWLQRGAVMRERGTLYPVCLAMWVLDMECSCIPNWNKLFFTFIEISLRILCDSPQSHLSSEF